MGWSPGNYALKKKKIKESKTRQENKNVATEDH